MTLDGDACVTFWSCFRHYVLAIFCLLTLVAFAWAFYRICQSNHKASRRDIVVLLLSIIQTLLGFIHYAIFSQIEILLAVRALKVFQAVVICWLFVSGLVTQSRYRRLWEGAFVLLSIYVPANYIFILFVFRPSQTGCRDASWLLLSVGWLVIALGVLALGLRVFRVFERHHGNVPGLPVVTSRWGGARSPDAQTASLEYPPRTTYTLETYNIEPSPQGSDTEAKQGTDPVNYGRTASSESLPSPVSELTPASGISGRALARVAVYRPPIEEEESYLQQKRKQLLVIIVIESISALVTVVWDIVMLVAIEDRHESCEYFLQHIPALEVVLYVITRAIGLLLPHWAVLYVFYWADRHLYEPLRQHWDVSLGGVEMEPPAHFEMFDRFYDQRTGEHPAVQVVSAESPPSTTT